MVGCRNCAKTIGTSVRLCPYCNWDQSVVASSISSMMDITADMTPKQRALFDAEYDTVKKDGGIGALLALLLGGLGVHHFYLGWWLAGLIYLLFCWTFIPMILTHRFQKRPFAA